MLVGQGARQWAREKGIDEVDDEFLKTGILNNFLFVLCCHIFLLKITWFLILSTLNSI